MELQGCCVARLHSLAIRKDDLDTCVGHFTVDVWRGMTGLVLCLPSFF
jgi:hypothetical protein